MSPSEYFTSINTNIYNQKIITCGVTFIKSSPIQYLPNCLKKEKSLETVSQTGGKIEKRLLQYSFMIECKTFNFYPAKEVKMYAL